MSTQAMWMDHCRSGPRPGLCQICSKCGGRSTTTCGCAEERFMKALTPAAIAAYEADKKKKSVDILRQQIDILRQQISSLQTTLADAQAKLQLLEK